jgi:hypothetical protein
MTDIRDVLQNRSTNLSRSLRDADEFRLDAAKSAIKRKRAVRTAVIGTAAGIAVVAIGAGAWAGYGAWRVGPATSQSPSATPSGSSTPSATPSAPEVAYARESGMTNDRALELASHPRTGEVWQQPEIYTPATPVVTDDSGGALFKVGTRANADIVAVVQPLGDYRGSGAPILALLEFDAHGIRLIDCPSANADVPCSPIQTDRFIGVASDVDSFYDSLTVPPTVEAEGDITLSTASEYPLGDAVRWPGLPDPAVGVQPWALWDTIEPESTLGASQLRLVRAMQSQGLFEGLESYNYGIETPFASYVTLPSNGVATLDGGGFAWDDGTAQVFADSPACEKWRCEDRWVAADVRCSATTMSLDTNHVADEWKAAGHMADGRTAYLPTDTNVVAKKTFALMKNQSVDVTTKKNTYNFATIDEFLAARAMVAFEVRPGEWAVAIKPDAVNNPYECA